MTASAHVPAPDLTFRDGTPVSETFGDVYFSKQGGIAETGHVFLRGNQLPQRFTSRDRFSIAELGFGTGLNFLVAWASWLKHADAGAQLHYISFEKFPLDHTQLTQALALQPELKPLADQLISAYPLRLPGFHRIHLPRVTLTLGFGDIAELLPQLSTRIDAWFLDGFAPAKNPEMWQETAFAEIGRLSAPDATFATFTAAGFVRRALLAQGFTVEKIPGYGHKREMLVGTRTPETQNLPASETLSREKTNTLPNPSLPNSVVLPREATADPRSFDVTQCHVERGQRNVLKRSGKDEPASQRGKEPPSIIIAGAGIAGATTARALAERGYRVTVLDHGGIASGASGNEAAVLFPQLPKRWTLAADWYFAGYSYMLHQLTRWQADGIDCPHTRCGMLRLPRHAEEEAQLRALNQTLGLSIHIAHWLERDAASARTGLPLATGGAYFPDGTWLKPQPLCASLLNHAAITVHPHTTATTLTRDGDRWRVTTSTGERFDADHCILATAHDTATLAQQYGLKLNPVAGQVSVFSASDATAPLRTILCHKGYVIPADDRILVGATYNHGDLVCAVTPENHQHNRAELDTILPTWLDPQATAIAGRTSLRATTPDRLPYIGQLDTGLWTSAGHGSRGMLSAPLAAEIIASGIHGETAPVTQALLRAVHPLRFKK